MLRKCLRSGHSESKSSRGKTADRRNASKTSASIAAIIFCFIILFRTPCRNHFKATDKIKIKMKLKWHTSLCTRDQNTNVMSDIIHGDGDCVFFHSLLGLRRRTLFRRFIFNAYLHAIASPGPRSPHPSPSSLVKRTSTYLILVIFFVVVDTLEFLCVWPIGTCPGRQSEWQSAWI